MRRHAASFALIAASLAACSAGGFTGVDQSLPIPLALSPSSDTTWPGDSVIFVFEARRPAILASCESSHRAVADVVMRENTCVARARSLGQATITATASTRNAIASVLRVSER